MTTVNKIDPVKEIASNRPITCIPMVRNIPKAKIREDIYYSLKIHGLFSREQKRCYKGSGGSRELLFIDQHILLNDCKTRWTNLEMAWIDYKKACDMVLQNWIINCLKMYKISNEVKNFIEKTMKSWRVGLTAVGRSLVETNIQRGIFQEDALSPLLFIIAMMPLNHIIRNYKSG